MAMGKNQTGTIAGKLNGLMIADGTERLTDRVHVQVRRRVLGVAALQQLRDATGELDDLEAAAHLAQGVVEHLAVLGGDNLGQLSGSLRS